MLSSMHPRERELLLAVDGELSRRRQTVVNEHVERCASCRVRLAQIRSMLAEANDLYASAFEPALPLSRMSRVRLELALQEAADEWSQSWLARLRAAFELSPTRATFGVIVIALLAVTWVSRPERIGGGSIRDFSAALPIATLTPGSVSSLTATDLCAGRRPSRLVTDESRRRVVRDYGMESVPSGTYELDALITPELGGTTAPENLWPQRFESPVWNARVKDELEKLLPELVCGNRVDLAQAQREIATDWVAAYKRYFRTDVPLQAQAGAPIRDDDDLEFAPVRYVAMSSTQVLRVSFTRVEY